MSSTRSRASSSSLLAVKQLLFATTKRRVRGLEPGLSHGIAAQRCGSAIFCVGTPKHLSSDSSNRKHAPVKLKNWNRRRQSQNVQELAEKTRLWLKTPSASWSSNDVALGRSLLEDWLRLPSSHPERPIWAHRILSQWIRTYSASNNQPKMISSEVLDMLHRVLYAWRMRVTEVVDAELEDIGIYEECRTLLDRMEQLYQETRDPGVRPGDKAYSVLLQILALSSPQDHPDACQEAIHLLQQCVEQRENNAKAPDVIVWNSCLHVLAKHSSYQPDAPEQAEALLDCMMRGGPLSKTNSTRIVMSARPPLPDTTSFASVLEVWSNSGRPGAAERANAILDRMIQQTNPLVPLPNTTCFNICIDAYSKSSKDHPKHPNDAAQRAQALLDSMLRSNQDPTFTAQPDHISFLSTMNAWAKYADHDTSNNAAHQAEALLKQMTTLYEETGDARIRPTPSCYAVVLDAWSRRPNVGPKVEYLLQEMEEDLTKYFTEENEEEYQMPASSSSREGSPLKSSFLAAIRAWGNTTNNPDAPENAEKIMQRMECQLEAELLPCAKIYSAVIAAWSKSGRSDAPERALALLRQMQKKEAANCHIRPNTIVFNSVLDVFAKAGDSKLAESLLREMKALHARGERDVQPDNVSYSTVMNALAKSPYSFEAAELATDLLEELTQLYHEEGDEKLKPSVYTFSSAIMAWSNSNHVHCGEKAEEIFWKMVNSSELEGGVKPNTVVCNCLLRAWSRSMEGEAPERADYVLKWMDEQVRMGSNDSVMPDRTTFHYAMQTWAKSRRLRATRRIEDLINRMIHESNNNPLHPLFPDAKCYNSLFLAIQYSKRRDKAIKSLTLLERLMTTSPNNAVKHWNQQSFQSVFLACLHTPNHTKESIKATKKVLQTTFNHLRSIEEPVPEKTIELALRASAWIGDTNDAFLVDVFRFCHERSSEVDVKKVLKILQSSTPPAMYKLFADSEEIARKRSKM